MKVLFTTTAGLGHVHPMVPLAAAFRDRGDDVLWAAATSVCDRLSRVGFDAAPAGLEADDAMASYMERFPEVRDIAPADRPDFTFPRYFGRIYAPPMLEAQLPIAREFHPDLMVCEAAELAGPIVAASLGVPGVTHSFGAVLPLHRLKGAAEQVAPLWESVGLEPRPFAGVYDHLYLSIYPPSLHAGAPPPVVEVQSVRPVPFAGSGSEELPELVTAGSAAPLVYVTFGTVFNWDPSVITRVLEGLSGLDIRVVVTLGNQGDPDALGPQPTNVHIARYIPQTQLLEHCSLVISHAGSGTFLAALSEGLPQLCLPQAADQFLNAAACARAGAGISIQPDEMTPDAVRTSVQRLLGEDSFRQAAARLKEEIAAMPAPGEVAEGLIGLVRQ